MLSTGDAYNYERSMQNPIQFKPYLRKRIVTVNDSNNGSYSGNQVTFDASSLANISSGEALLLREGTIDIPLMITLQVRQNSATDLGPAQGGWDHFVGFKNGSWQILNSISITYGNVEVHSPSAQFLNAILSYRVLSTWSESDVSLYGDACLFAIDTPNCWCYNSIDKANTSGGATGQQSRLYAGNGFVANYIWPDFNEHVPANLTNAAPPVISSDIIKGFPDNNKYFRMYKGNAQFGNSGLLRRIKLMNQRPDLVAGTGVLTQFSLIDEGVDSTVFQNLGSVRNNNNYINELKNYSNMVNPSAQNCYSFYKVLASIPLRVFPFFEALPITRSSYLKINCVLNLGYVEIFNPLVPIANTSGQFVTNSSIGFQYSCPLMVTQRLEGLTTNATAASASDSLLLSVGVVSAFSCSVPNFQNPSSLNTNRCDLSTCRITCPVVELDADSASTYFTSGNKLIEWEDWYSNMSPIVQANGTLDYLVSNGTANLTSIVIIGMAAGGTGGHGVIANGSTAAIGTVGFRECLSPFSTCPATPSPASSLINLQVLVGGRNIYNDVPVSYVNEHYMLSREVGKINGGLLGGLSVAKGWTKDEFESSYRYYTAVVRDSDSKVNQSVQIKLTNNSQLAMEYLVVLFRKRSMVINPSNGAVVE